ncbi:MAG: hypothetical protein ACJA01_003179 [Saprospiraceae bacterium]|jgi:hypothetical protein
MKKIGILFGMENTYPWAFINRVNEKAKGKFIAEAVKVETVHNDKNYDYAVIIDRISQDVPFYRAFLKNAALKGTAVINNPFWWSADEKYFNYTLSHQLGIPTPKTVLIPSNARPDDTDERSFRNLNLMEWDDIFEYLTFPFFMKPHSGGGWKSVYKIHNKEEFFEKYNETGQLVMTLQENIDFDSYYRCYGLETKDIHVMPYEPRNEPHLRYVADFKPSAKLLKEMISHVKSINGSLGYDFNTCEFAIKDGIPYAIDFGNPAPDADLNSVGEENFEWIVEHTAEMALRRAKAHKDGQQNLTWGSFVNKSVAGKSL